MGGIASILKGQLFQYQNNKKMRNNRIQKEINNNFLKIKCIISEEEFRKEFDETFNSRVLWDFVTANFIPNSIKELGRYLTVASANTFLFDIRWIFYCVKKNASVINKFVRGRREIDSLILFSKYEEALSLLEGVERECGVSYWSCEYKEYLYKKLNMDSKDRGEGPKGLASFILACLQIKNSDNISYDEYRYFIERKIKSISRDIPRFKDSDAYLTYMLIKRELIFSEENIGRVLKYVSNDSIIDQYLLLLDICEALLGEKEQFEFYQIVNKAQ